MMKNLKKIKNQIEKSKHIAIVCHQNPDGDTLGSAFALHTALAKMKKQSKIICEDTLPYKYRFMDKVEIANRFEAIKYDFVIFLDCSDIKQTGSILAEKDLECIISANLDHHSTNTKYATYDLVDSSYSSAAEIVLELIKELDIKVDREIAEYIYVAMVTDTGQFAYSYTSHRTHKNAAYLHKKGIDFSKLNELLFNTTPMAKIMLTKAMLNNMCFYKENRIAVSLLDFEDFKSAEAVPADTESLVNLLLSVEGVETAALIRQIDSDKFKISFRSSDGIDISKAAKLLGGGGHKQACGATIICEKIEAVNTVLSSIENSGALK